MMTITHQRAPLVDWNMVFLNLRNEGYSLNDIAAMVGIPRATMQGWMMGAEPRHSDGETIISFWSETTTLPRECVPVQTSKAFISRIAQSRA